MTFPCRIAFWSAAVTAAAVAAGETVLYVSPQGNDNWSGRALEANADKTDGPLATLTAARDAIRKLRAGGAATPFTAFIGGHVYVALNASGGGGSAAATAAAGEHQGDEEN
ncbi:MAG: hypothetical protein NTW87_16700, partial [Planctomycetota bacterium]|nr:hypothetical protein [Planctomycetota bacterium]